jgi:hypothetical protein
VKARLASIAAAVVAAALLAPGCAAQQREARLRQQLDATVIERPLAEVWPAALRLLDERGFPLAGGDPARIGKSPQGTLARLVSRGRETYTAPDGRWVAETGLGRDGLRYRVEGWDRGGAGSRVVYTAVEGQPAGSAGADRTSRDVELELALLRELDPERAARVVEAAGK